VIALLAGAAAVLAFAPAGLYPLAWLSFGILIHLLVRSPGKAFRTGFWFGLGLFGAGVSWVYVSLHVFGAMPAVLAGIATAVFCALLALFTGFATWLQARIPASDTLRACLLVPAAWTLGEWLRTWLLSGFPWLAAGYGAAGWPLQGYAPLLGVLGMSFATVSLAGLLWIFVYRRRRIVPAIAFVAALAAGEALRHVPWTHAEGAPVRAALLQGNVAQEMKFRPERYARILETYARLAEETNAALIVLPETAVPRFYDAVDPAYVARLEALARRNRGDLLLGVPYRTTPQDYYNSVVTLGSAPRQLYHKRHLVPFGEFVPPGFGWALRLVDIPMSDFVRGEPDARPLEVAGQRVAANICYEDAFGDEIRRRAAAATLLVNLSNVAWFGDSLAPAQHLQIARLRAAETGRVYLTATNTGITAALDRDGRVLAELPQFKEGRLEVEAQGYSGATPYVRFGDWPIVLISFAVLAAAAVMARRRHR
jgi:apolipoprotein N-acyltransferase